MTGWTWDYVDQHMDLPRLYALNAQWQRTPPLPALAARIACALGAWKPEVDGADSLQAQSEGDS